MIEETLPMESTSAHVHDTQPDVSVTYDQQYTSRYHHVLVSRVVNQWGRILLALSALLLGVLATNAGTALAAPVQTRQAQQTHLQHVVSRLDASTVHVMAFASCSGVHCDNTDPYTTNCASGSYWVVTSSPLTDVVTHTTSWNYGYLQLWWSQTCQTNWIRGQVYESGSVDNYYRMQTQAGSPSVVHSNRGTLPDWTNQWYTGNASACGIVEISFSSGGPNYVRYEAEVNNPGYTCSYDF
jgi:hypothetical protein